MKGWWFCDQCEANPYFAPAGTAEEQRRAIAEHKVRVHGNQKLAPGEKKLKRTS